MLGEADEDYLSATFGTLLTSSAQTVVDDSGREWTWKMETARLGSRGKGRGGEPVTGADVILQLVFERRGRSYPKGLLIQSKVRGRDEGDLLTQCKKLGTWSGAAIVAHVGPSTIRAADPADVRRVGLENASEEAFTKALDRFLNCRIGAHGLYYEPGVRKLYWPLIHGQTAATTFAGAVAATATFGVGRTLKLRPFDPGPVIDVKPEDVQSGAYQLDLRRARPDEDG